MKWPRGRYNGRWIVGFNVRLIVDLTYWDICLPRRFGGCLQIGPARLWIQPEYESWTPEDIEASRRLGEWCHEQDRAGS